MLVQALFWAQGYCNKENRHGSYPCMGKDKEDRMERKPGVESGGLGSRQKVEPCPRGSGTTKLFLIREWPDLMPFKEKSLKRVPSKHETSWILSPVRKGWAFSHGNPKTPMAGDNVCWETGGYTLRLHFWLTQTYPHSFTGSNPRMQPWKKKNKWKTLGKKSLNSWWKRPPKLFSTWLAFSSFFRFMLTPLLYFYI